MLGYCSAMDGHACERDLRGSLAILSGWPVPPVLPLSSVFILGVFPKASADKESLPTRKTARICDELVFRVLFCYLPDCVSVVMDSDRSDRSRSPSRHRSPSSSSSSSMRRRDPRPPRTSESSRRLAGEPSPVVVVLNYSIFVFCYV